MIRKFYSLEIQNPIFKSHTIANSKLRNPYKTLYIYHLQERVIFYNNQNPYQNDKMFSF